MKKLMEIVLGSFLTFNSYGNFTESESFNEEPVLEIGLDRYEEIDLEVLGFARANVENWYDMQAMIQVNGEISLREAGFSELSEVPLVYKITGRDGKEYAGISYLKAKPLLDLVGGEISYKDFTFSVAESHRDKLWNSLYFEIGIPLQDKNSTNNVVLIRNFWNSSGRAKREK